LAVKAINNTAGPNSLMPMLLVSRVYLRILDNSPPLLLITQQAKAMKKAIEEVH
ncbi:hypothetical protein LX36DRAFT_594259, partial [Colletotrichum falcatum]